MALNITHDYYVFEGDNGPLAVSNEDLCGQIHRHFKHHSASNSVDRKSNLVY
jgi:hypothetical protein